MEKYGQKEELLEIKEFVDLRGVDLSERNLRTVSIEALEKTDFDTFTKWPDVEKLPEGFNPEKIIEEGKNPGLGIRELHEEGIDGRGVIVAIIDQAMSSERGIVDHNNEYSLNIIDYKEFGVSSDDQISMHGPAVASLLVGKSCGVAPEAKLVYRAVQSGEDDQGNRDFNNQADALLDIIEYNKKCSERDRVRIVSCSIGYMEDKPEPGLDRWINIIKKAEEEGIIVSDVGNRTGVKYLGGGASKDKENIDDYEYALFLEENEDKEISRLVSEGDVDGILRRLREIRGDEIVNISDEELRVKIVKRIGNFGKEDYGIIVPSDYRTMSSRNGENEYMYNAKGGMSWSVPYLTGIFALVLQIKPDMKKEQIAEVINRTALKNKKGLKVVNPRGVIEEVKKMI